jgi:hypothetical protein
MGCGKIEVCVECISHLTTIFTFVAHECFQLLIVNKSEDASGVVSVEVDASKLRMRALQRRRLLAQQQEMSFNDLTKGQVCAKFGPCDQNYFWDVCNNLFTSGVLWHIDNSNVGFSHNFMYNYFVLYIISITCARFEAWTF